MLDQVFAGIAVAFGSMVGAPYVEATAIWPGTPEEDDGGSIVDPSPLIKKPCLVQFDTPTQAMRQAEGFLESDMRLLVLTASLDGALDTSVRIVADNGTWQLLTCQGDPAGIGYECRARRLP